MQSEPAQTIVTNSKVEHFARRVIDSVCSGVNSIGMIVVLVMMLLTTTDVILRNFFDKPITGAFELTEIMMLIVVFFGLAYAANKKRHIYVDIVVSHFSKKVQTALESITYLLSLVTCLLITWKSTQVAIELLSTGQTTGSLYIPIYPFVLLVALGCALLSLVLLVNFIQSLGQAWKNTWTVRLVLIGGFILALFIAMTPIWMQHFEASKSTIGIVGVLLMLLLLASGMHIGFVMAFVGFLGYACVRGLNPGLSLLGSVPYSSVASVSLSLIPLFILMGEFTFFSGISQDLYHMAYKWLGRLPGGLAIATIGACGGFAACTGSSLAGSVTMGQVALPEMRRHRYDAALATGCVAAGGTLGIMIPPSNAFAFYGIMTDQSIGKLFISGILPGILLIVIFMSIIYITVRRNFILGPPGPKTSFVEKVASLKNVWGMLLLFLLVVGGIYQGFFTPTEAGAVGAFGALVIALIRKKINTKNFVTSLLDTGQTTAMVFTILIGAFIFGYFLTVTNLPADLADFVSGLALNRYVILGIMVIFYLVLGCFLDVGAMVLITIPITFPISQALGFDPIWFGVVIVLMCEAGMITPPVGMNVFALYGVAKDVPLYTIFRGIIPFLVGMVICVILLTIWPQIALFLPNMMKG